MEFHGIFQEIFHETEVDEISWKFFMEFHGIPLNFMEFHEFMECHEIRFPILQEFTTYCMRKKSSKTLYIDCFGHTEVLVGDGDPCFSQPPLS
jgi:hypothetical protein